MKAAVIGYPIDHSFSPMIFFYFSHFKDEMMTYEKIRISEAEDELKFFLQGAKKDHSFLGVNVTIPHKRSVLPFCDELSEGAREVGAANVLHFCDGKSKGYNTDIYGIEKSLDYFQEKSYWKMKRVLLIGAGGAAQAVFHVLCQYDVKAIVILNRSKNGEVEFLKKWKDKFPQIEFEWEVFDQIKVTGNKLEKDNLSFDLVINCTPLGMNGLKARINENGIGEEIFSFIFQKKFSAAKAYAFDLIYQPRETSFLRLAGQSGLMCLGGLEMLVQQAKATWEIWFQHKDSTIDEVGISGCRNFLQEIISIREKKKNIVLIGFMGSGKSTIGKILADFLGGEFVDTDHLIEVEQRKTISEIFNENGERFFREYEGKILRKLLEEKKTRESNTKNELGKCYIYSTGGGILLGEGHGEMIQELGMIIYLECSSSELMKRLALEMHKRPILTNLSPRESLSKIEELLLERKSDYEAFANFIIPSGEMSKSACIIDIIHQASQYQASQYQEKKNG